MADAVIRSLRQTSFAQNPAVPRSSSAGFLSSCFAKEFPVQSLLFLLLFSLGIPYRIYALDLRSFSSISSSDSPEYHRRQMCSIGQDYFQDKGYLSSCTFFPRVDVLVYEILEKDLARSLEYDFHGRERNASVTTRFDAHSVVDNVFYKSLDMASFAGSQDLVHCLDFMKLNSSMLAAKANFCGTTSGESVRNAPCFLGPFLSLMVLCFICGSKDGTEPENTGEKIATSSNRVESSLAEEDSRNRYFTPAASPHNSKRKESPSGSTPKRQNGTDSAGNSASSGTRSSRSRPSTTNSTSTGARSSSAHIGDHAVYVGVAKRFRLAEILEATNNFDNSLILGEGGFGKVYKGKLPDGTETAMKRSNPMSGQGLPEFKREIKALSAVRHRHLVSLIGFCKEREEMILVYEFMSKGSLRSHLYGNLSFQPLSWEQRLQICIGAARGLHYLHTGAVQGIIHRDVKSSNILLDDNYLAKLSDFGLSKPINSDVTHVSTAVKGSFGYLDPEYFSRMQLTEKSDVYSFGVVLFEIVCAKPPINPALPGAQANSAKWVARCYRLGMLETAIDPHLRGRYEPNSMHKFVEIAQKCVAERGTDRPTMGTVLWSLESALKYEMEGNAGRPPLPPRMSRNTGPVAIAGLDTDDMIFSQPVAR